MTTTTRQAQQMLFDLPIEKFLTATNDVTGEEYIIDGIKKRKLHGDLDNDWYYTLVLRPVSGQCLIR